MIRYQKQKWSKQVTEWYPSDSRIGGRKARWENDLKITLGPL